MLCGSFRLYPSCAAGILNSVSEIHFYVLYTENLNYADDIEKCIDSKECSVTYEPHKRDGFRQSISEAIAFFFKQDNFQNHCSNKYLRKLYWRKYAFRRYPSALCASISVWPISVMK